MSTHSQWNAAELPGISQACETIFRSGNASSQITPEYVSLQENEQQDAHASAGEVIVFCVLGEVTVKVEGQDHRLRPNQLAHIGPGALYKLTSNASSAVLLLTLVSKHPDAARRQTLMDDDADVQEASEESFPASDSPSFNPGT